MEQKQLNFAEQAVQVLTLGELERSYHENLPTGDPVGGIYHFALIQQVLAIFEKRGKLLHETPRRVFSSGSDALCGAEQPPFPAGGLPRFCCQCHSYESSGN